MKKDASTTMTKKKIRIKRETVRVLSARELDLVAAGACTRGTSDTSRPPDTTC